jgi:hypothetical protein
MRTLVTVRDIEADRMLADIAAFEGSDLVINHIRSGFATMLSR